MQCGAYRPFCPTKILANVVPGSRFKTRILPTVEYLGELLAQNYIISRNPKIFKFYFSQSTSLKKEKIQHLFFMNQEHSIFQNGILKMN
jgi:hypothetical protein